MVRVEEVGDVVRALLSTLTGDVSPADLKLYQEVEALADFIHKAKAEIAQLRPSDIGSQYIASATDELDAIIGATEAAANTILDSAEKMEAMATELSTEHSRRLSDITTALYEACNFQDLTGQRITKVVRALKHIEERVEALVHAFGPEGRDAPAPGAATDAAKTGVLSDQDLLNGPQLPEKAPDQADIDALFSNG
jgi:chemotaxis protein CheZ